MARDPAALAPLDPEAARHLQRARTALAAGQVEAAWQALQHAQQRAPEHPEVAREAGLVAGRCGAHAEAVAACRRALQRWPDDADVHMALGISLHALGAVEAAIRHLRRGCELAPHAVRGWYNLAEALRPLGRVDAAMAAARHALAIEPGFQPAQLALARAELAAGQVAAATTTLRAVLDRDGASVEAWVTLGNLKTCALDASDVSRLRACLARAALPVGDRARLGFVLARALEDTADFDAAWVALREANALRRQGLRWDAAGEHRRVNAVLRAFAAPVTPAVDPDLGRGVIFIASLPRSGSTLVEQILASHPAMAGANEIADLPAVVNAQTARTRLAFPLWVPQATAADWHRMGLDYLARTARWRAGTPGMTDKNLLNWLLAGAALAMLPAARVIVVRRDPLETCLACHRQWFAGDEGFTTDLHDLAQTCADAARLARHWAATFPARVHDLAIEDLVAAPELVIRRLLDFCGLPFDAACLTPERTRRAVLSTPSAAQVREPIHRMPSRVARYGRHLDELRTALRDAGLDPDQSPAGGRLPG